MLVAAVQGCVNGPIGCLELATHLRQANMSRIGRKYLPFRFRHAGAIAFNATSSFALVAGAVGARSICRNVRRVGSSTGWSRREGSLQRRHARIVSVGIRVLSLQKYVAVCDVATSVVTTCRGRGNYILTHGVAVFVLACDCKRDALKLSFFSRGLSVDASMKPSCSSGKREEEVGKEEEVRNFHDD